MCAPEAPAHVLSLGVRAVPRAESRVRRPDRREPPLAASAGPLPARDLGPSLCSLGPSARAAGVDTKVLWILSRLSARM